MTAPPQLPLADFDYTLPVERIAQTPAQPRDSSRLLHLGRDGGCTDHRFSELPDLLRPGDLLVANDTRVRAARLRGQRDDGGEAEVLLLRRLDGNRYAALVRPGRRLHAGARVCIGDVAITVEGPASGHPGARVVSIDSSDPEAVIAASGEAPLPPYIRERHEDASRYQTTYARGEPESAAAPTAGLHFTDAVRQRLGERGIGWTAVRLEVGLGTFAPITSDDVSAHRMHEERCSVPPEAAAAIAHTRAEGGRVIAVGTTVVRTLESRARPNGEVEPGEITTDLFITPGHRFAVVDGLLTNFHQPRSSLLVLLAAFAGAERWRSAYDHALHSGYRFLSFGDCMLCWRA